MKIKWTLIAHNWEHSFVAEESSDPIEITTTCIENIYNLYGPDINFGIILELKNSKMKSASEHIIMLSSTILANAGFYSTASQLDADLKYISKNI